MRRVYFFILLVLIIGKKIESTACGEATTEACDPVVLRCCDANFRADLNIPSTVCNGASTYYNPSCYRSQIVQAYRDGKAEGVLMVCKAFASYRTCLGISGLSCYSVDYFVQHSFDPNQAKTYVQMIRELTFACGGGLESYLLNDICMSNTYATNATILAQCETAYLTSTTSPDQICFDLLTLTKCYAQPFNTNCGKESGWWGCEFARSGISAHHPECTAACTVSQKLPSIKVSSP